jgi:hypothetical protein
MTLENDIGRMVAAMKQLIAAIAAVALIAFAFASDARAGRWEWGCVGTTTDAQVVFNRRQLAVVPPQKRLGKIQDLIFVDELAKDFNADQHYDAADENGGLTATMAFARGEDAKQKITLTEKSSKTLFNHTAMVCGRDEDKTITRKVYRLEQNGEPPRNITMQCLEYMLTTRGGRPCINRP